MKNFKDIFEKFTDIGRLSDDELKKGNALTDEDFKLVKPRTFKNIINKLKRNDLERDMPKGLNTLTEYSIKEYSKMKCYIGPNNSSGYAIKRGELVSVFSTQKSSGHAIVKSAIKNGARNLDCFAKIHNNQISGALFSLYYKHGFKIDKTLNEGNQGEAYSIQNGISNYVDDNGKVDFDNPNVVVYMKL